MTPDFIRRAIASPAARDPGPQERFAVFLPDGSGPIDPPTPPPGREPRQAAVLIPLYQVGDELRVLLTLRTDAVSHAGQISFPGGSRDAGDADLAATALRETHEELALAPSAFELLGDLAPVYVPPTNFLVTPYVGLHIGQPRHTAHVGEVAEVLEIPLALFLTDDAVHREQWTLRGQPYLVRFFRWRPDGGRSYDIWGATARMLSMLAATLRSSDGTR